jgi:predicted AlkP superfamily pyrophosphatase or phosphodiesterase
MLRPLSVRAGRRACAHLVVFLFAWWAGPVDGQSIGAPPRLVLQITVDQLRGDLPARHYDRLGEGGFRYLLDEGTVYLDANHGHANTETVVGHATLATGADPAAHGMIGNIWLDRSSGLVEYGVEDARYPILTAGAGVDDSTEIDPTQRAAQSDGRSPSAILVSTFSDELMLRYGGASKVFGVSVKDRGAITMAGHAGKAFWFSKQAGAFVTSSFYYDDMPAWVEDWNAAGHIDGYARTSWELLREPSSYLFAEDDRPWEIALPGYGRTFPHAFGDRDSRYFTTLLTLSPVGDELTLDFAKTLIDAERLGTDAVPDYLSISFSSTDYVGHFFGPSSLEAEDNLLRLDRTLAELFRFVDDRVGLENTLIVLSADHGGADAPGHLAEVGFEADYVVPDEWDSATAVGALKDRFGIGDELITTYAHPYIYLNRDLIQERGLDQAEVEQAVAEVLTSFDGVALAVGSSALRTGRVPDTPLLRSVLRNYSPSRSGDVYVVFEPNRFINDFDGTTVAASHGSPWRYDTFVPIIIAGAGVPAQSVSRPVETVDIALTLALMLGTKPPSGAVGEPLHEVIARR